MFTIRSLAGTLAILCVASHTGVYAIPLSAIFPLRNAALASPTALIFVTPKSQLPPRDFATSCMEEDFDNPGLCIPTTPLSESTTNTLSSQTQLGPIASASSLYASSSDASNTIVSITEITSPRSLSTPTSDPTNSTTEPASTSLPYALPPISSATGSHGATSTGTVIPTSTPSGTEAHSMSVSSEYSVTHAATTSLLNQSNGTSPSPTPGPTDAQSPPSDAHIWVIVLIVACIVLTLALVFLGTWYLRKRHARKLARHFPFLAESHPSGDPPTFAKLCDTSNLDVSELQPHTPSIRYVQSEESPSSVLCSVEQCQMGYNTVGANDVTSVVDYPLGAHIRTSAQLTGRPTLRLSLGNIDSFMCQSDTIPSSTTWQSPQGPLRSASPKLAIRPSSSGVGLGRLSWQSALTPRTTASRSVVNDLPSWPARPASHSRPRGPRPHVGRSRRTLYRDQDIPDAREDTTVSLSQRRADDGGVRLAGGPLPMAMQAAPSGDKGRSDGRVSGSGSGSSEDTLPPAYAVY